MTRNQIRDMMYLLMIDLDYHEMWHIHYLEDGMVDVWHEMRFCRRSVLFVVQGVILQVVQVVILQVVPEDYYLCVDEVGYQRMQEVYLR